MKRRTLLVSALSGAALGLLGWRFSSSHDSDGIAAVLRLRLSYLRLDEAGLQRFARDLAATHQISSGRLHLLLGLGPLYRRLDTHAHNFFTDGVRHGEERIVTMYLLSTDFFANGSDASRVVNYLGLYDPLRACGSPFARRAWPRASTG